MIYLCESTVPEIYWLKTKQLVIWKILKTATGHSKEIKCHHVLTRKQNKVIKIAFHSKCKQYAITHFSNSLLSLVDKMFKRGVDLQYMKFIKWVHDAPI